MKKNIDQSLLDTFLKYGNSISSKDIKSTINFIYPKLFDFIPKKTIESSLKAAYNNKSIDVEFRNFGVDKVNYESAVKATEYKIITTSCSQATKFLNAIVESDDADEAEFYYENLKEKYGVDNVEFDRQNRIVTANASNTLLAIKESNGWFFLDVRPHFVGLYGQFLPPTISEELSKLFPVEEEQDDEEQLEVDEIRPEKINTVTDISDQPHLKSLFLIGWEVLLNGDQDCENFMVTQVTNQQTFEHAYSGLELIFEKKKLIKVHEYTDGKKKVRRLKKEEIGLPYKAYKPNIILRWKESILGVHQLGGEKPNNFHLPENQCVVPFQYLGFIDTSDKNFKWLPFKLHLTCPIYLNIDKVFLDYTKPLSPVIINKAEVENADTSHEDDLDRDSEIVFSDVAFNFVEDVKFSSLGNSGIPNWIQYPDIPMCPKSGNRMRFVCQLHGGVTIKRSNVKPKEEWSRRYFEELNFWGDGDLFIFFEPASKVACYFIQNT